MNICEKHVFAVENLAVRLSKQLFAALPENGRLVVITDETGSVYSSNEAVFAEVFARSQDIKSVCSRVADGQDPLCAVINGHDVLATQIESSGPGTIYAIMAIPQSKSAPDIEMAEMLFAQIELIAGLIEEQVSCTASSDVTLEQSFICN